VKALFHHAQMEPAKVIYGKRKTIIEPVFGQIKNSGFRGFSVRSKENVAGEFSMVCAAHNFKIIANAIVRGGAIKSAVLI